MGCHFCKYFHPNGTPLRASKFNISIIQACLLIVSYIFLVYAIFTYVCNFNTAVHIEHIIFK